MGDIIQMFEQLSATLRDNATTLWLYYNDLKKEGFTDEQAFTLVRDFQHTMFGGKREDN